MPWRDLGVVSPSENLWMPFLATTGTNEIFRVTYNAPRAIDRLVSHAWIAWKPIDGPTPLPSTLAVKLYPDSRGRLLIPPFSVFPQQLINLGYQRRIFEVRKSRQDLEWWMQLEELI